MSAEIDLLLDLSGEPMCWNKHKRHPSGLLRNLAEKGFAEVETRACSPWSFGPKQPPYIRWNAPALDRAAAKQYEKDSLAYKMFQVQHPASWRMRSEVWAKITDMGIEHLRSLKLLN